MSDKKNPLIGDRSKVGEVRDNAKKAVERLKGQKAHMNFHGAFSAKALDAGTEVAKHASDIMAHRDSIKASVDKLAKLRANRLGA